MKRTLRARWLWAGIALALVLGLPCLSARAADDVAPAAVLKQAAAAVERGAFDEAVDALELLGDRGVVHPDVSYARAHAYVARARSRARRSGDLGRAVAALEESRWLRPDDELERPLEVLRAEIAKERAREGNTEIVQRPALGRAVTELFSENTWLTLALIGEAALTFGLFALLNIKRRGYEIAGAVSTGVGLLLTLLGGGFGYAARQYRLVSEPAVVVVAQARLLDSEGRALPTVKGSPSGVPEGALVYVRQRREGRARVEWGSLEAWLDVGQLRRLQTTPTIITN